MSAYLNYFFDTSHLFALYPTALQQRAIYILLAIFGFCLVFGLLSFAQAKRTDALRAKGWRRLGRLGITMGILGLVYVFFGAQKVTLLGSRFWLLIWAIVAIVWLVFILVYLFVNAPKRRAELDREREKRKYLP